MALATELAQSPEVSFDTWQRVLANPTRLEWLLRTVRRYQDMFTTAIKRCIDFLLYDEITFLVDCDVLRCLLEPESGDAEDSYVTEFWFEHSEISYGLPAGAFLELIEYLAITAPSQVLSAAPMQGANPQQTIKMVAEAVGIRIEKFDELAPGELLHRISDKSHRLDRLINFLTNPRFIGMVGSYSTNDAAVIRQLLALAPRRRRVRSRVDDRDATNLAIVARNCREMKAKRESREGNTNGLFLVSNTKAVCDLCANAATEADPELVQRFVSVFGSPDTPIQEMHYPVIRSDEATDFELFGVFNEPLTVMADLKIRRDQFRNIVRYCEDQITLFNAGALDERRLKILRPVFGGREREFWTVLQNVAEDFRANRDGLGSLEVQRTARIAVKSASERLQKEGIDQEQRLLEASTDFMRIINEIYHHVAKVEGFAYRIEWGDISAELVRTFKIVQEPEDAAESAILDGELITWPYSKGDGPDYYCIHWPTSLDDVGLFRRVSEIFGGGDDNVSVRHVAPILSRVDSLQVDWRYGVIVATAGGMFGAELSSDLRRQLQSYTLDNIGARLRAASGSEDQSLFRTVCSYRILTPLGHVAFEVMPDKRTGLRYVHFFSDVNTREKLLSLLWGTRKRFLVKHKLLDCLQSVLVKFPTPTESMGDVVKNR